ncbi:MAG: hypothetical protein R3E74_14860 [Pseudomonadales bacterium]
MAESESNSGNPAHPGGKTGHEGVRLRNAESTSKAYATIDGKRSRTSELGAIGTTSTDMKQIDRKAEGATRTEQKIFTDRLKGASESEKNAYLKQQLEKLERSKRELNLPSERRALIQSDNVKDNIERTREQLVRARLTANEIAETKSAELLAEQRRAKLERAYAEFKEGTFNGTLERGDGVKSKVDGKDLIIPKDAPRSPESPEFWNHHQNTKEVYDKFARQYPEIQKQLAGGKTIAEIGMDSELKDAARFWYGKQDDLVANEYKSYMFVDKGYHRANLAREYNLADVPVSVYQWSEKENK